MTGPGEHVENALRAFTPKKRGIPAPGTGSQIARAIGAPRAVRAVGSACGANPVALVIPCHRALRADGSLGGYAWGLARKRKLLRLEQRTRRK